MWRACLHGGEPGLGSLLTKLSSTRVPVSESKQQQASAAEQRSLPPGLAVRAIRPQDLEAVAAMQDLPGFRWGTMRLLHSSPEHVRSWIERTLPGSASLVATISGQIIGCATVECLQRGHAHMGRISMGVHDAWTRQGVGTALLRAIVDVAHRSLGLRRLELLVHADNAPALALYRRSGFVSEDRHHAYAMQDNRSVATLVLIRRM